MTPALGAIDLVAAAAKKSGTSPTIFIFLIIGAAFYFLIYRPQQRKQKAARAQASGYEVGDEVVTAGGIVGHVLDITDDRVTLETSVGASFVVLKPYILRKLEPVEPPPDVVNGSDGHEDDDDEEGHDAHPGATTSSQAPTEEPPADPPADPPSDPPSTTRHGGDDPDGTDTTGADGPSII
jgi:preprotein translocase subunit YajC